MFNGPVAAKEACEGALSGFPLALVNAIGIDFEQLPVPPTPSWRP